uniref:Bestrophin homolog n=1 Tax=Ascaris lumbricoides TaxID=6252 RepID=A0A0M3IUN3_ASCLU
MEDLWPPSGGQTWRLIAQAVDDSRVAFNRACVHLEPWQVVSYTLSVAFLTLWQLMEDLWPPSGGQTWRLIAQAVDDSRVAFNRACVHLEPWQVVSYTLSVAFLTLWFRRIMKSDRPMTQRIRAAATNGGSMAAEWRANVASDSSGGRRQSSRLQSGMRAPRTLAGGVLYALCGFPHALVPAHHEI